VRAAPGSGSRRPALQFRYQEKRPKGPDSRDRLEQKGGRVFPGFLSDPLVRFPDLLRHGVDQSQVALHYPLLLTAQPRPRLLLEPPPSFLPEEALPSDLQPLGMQVAVDPVHQLRPVPHEPLPVPHLPHQVPLLLRFRVHLRHQPHRQEPPQHPRVDLVRLHVRLRDRLHSGRMGQVEGHLRRLQGVVDPRPERARLHHRLQGTQSFQASRSGSPSPIGTRFRSLRIYDRHCQVAPVRVDSRVVHRPLQARASACMPSAFPPTLAFQVAPSHPPGGAFDLLTGAAAAGPLRVGFPDPERVREADQGADDVGESDEGPRHVGPTAGGATRGNRSGAYRDPGGGRIEVFLPDRMSRGGAGDTCDGE